MDDYLSKPIQYVKGVGPAKAKLFEAIGVQTIGQLIAYLPYSYEDRTNLKCLNDIVPGEFAVARVKCILPPTSHFVRKNMEYINCLMRDESGSVQVVIFNQRFLLNKLKVGNEYLICGNFNYKNVLQVSNPLIELITPENEQEIIKKMCRIMPQYHLVKGLNQRMIRETVDVVLKSKDFFIDDYLDENDYKKLNLLDINTAYREYHYPSNMDMQKSASRRLAFDELLKFQVALYQMKSSNNNKGGKQFFVKDEQKLENIHKFIMTNAQKRVLKEIVEDMKKEKPMTRLVQGDVGSGKTAIAMSAIYLCVENGYQAVLMAPTEILASQHYESFNEVMSQFGYKTVLLKSKMASSEKREVLKQIENNEANIIIGTHALLQENVKFSNVGLVITDEQHRFGVKQRNKLTEKSNVPDVLVMTATPIPRTLALVLYGDLDISIVDELPPNRQEIKTYALKMSERERAFNFVNEQIKEGRQAYVVCPLIEETEKYDAMSANELFDELKIKFPNLNIELIHGKLSPKEKEEIMDKNANNEISILVSTTVIEVGINVPNASIMLVVNSEKFGLSQLHQLRGRVGRGKYQSYCILLHDAHSKIAIERLKIMQDTNDGFVIAEKDLHLRGPGDFFGTMQHGLPQFKVANLYEDIEIIKLANGYANEIVKKSLLDNPKYVKLKRDVNSIDFNSLN